MFPIATHSSVVHHECDARDFVSWHSPTVNPKPLHSVKTIRNIVNLYVFENFTPVVIWSIHKLTLTALKLHSNIRHFFARVIATLTLCGLIKNPLPLVLDIDINTISYSCP